jgi:protein-S-isoprenylcysteine O-methyltransferase Ste14
MVPAMTALSLDTARNVGVIIAVALGASSLASALVVKNMVVKLITVALTAGLALGIWSQRSALQDCAHRVQADPTTGTTCHFFGTDVNVPGAP